MPTDDLAAWLRAQLDEEEAAAELLRQQAREVRQELKGPCLLGKPMPGWGLWPDVERMAAGVLAGVAAKRAVLGRCTQALESTSDHGEKYVWNGTAWARPDDTIAEAVIRALGTSYADRPGYREEWRP